ncbi:hypothetical protein J5751_00725 [bacterium]|nr:hypothetical protein [bacterium]
MLYLYAKNSIKVIVKKSLDFCFVKVIYDSEILFDILGIDDLDYENFYKHLITRV